MSKKNRKQKGDTPVALFLQRELSKMMKNPCSEYFKVHGLLNDNIQKWEIYVIGPPNTFYAEGVYKAILEFPDEYPIQPPTLRFETQIFHPNVYKTGKVCISTLQVGNSGKDTGQYWRPVLGVEQAVLSVISLLSDPNNEDPANAAAATMFKADKDAFIKRCRENAARSLKQLPEDFEYPEVIAQHAALDIIKDEEAKQALDTSVKETIEEDLDDDEWEYDVEDLSEDDDDDSELDDETPNEVPVVKKDDDNTDSSSGFEKENTSGSNGGGNGGGKQESENGGGKSSDSGGNNNATNTATNAGNNQASLDALQDQQGPPPNTWRVHQNHGVQKDQRKRKSSLRKSLGKLASAIGVK